MARAQAQHRLHPDRHTSNGSGAHAGLRAEARFHQRHAGFTSRGGQPGTAHCHGVANAGRDVATETGACGIFAARRAAQRRTGASRSARRCHRTTSHPCWPRAISTPIRNGTVSNRHRGRCSTCCCAIDVAGIRRRGVAAADQRGCCTGAAPRAGAGESASGTGDATVWGQ